MERKLYNETEQKVLNYLEENKEELFYQLSELVKIDTQNFRTHGNENAGQDYLEQICLELGLKVDRFTPDSVEGLTDSDEYNPGRGTENRENLVAVYEGENPEGGIMLAAHMDTMPVGDLSKWDDSPFSGLIKNNKIYGRGSGDDKFGLALGWYVIKALKECGFSPKKNIMIGSYVDEEYGGGNGALGLCLKYPCDCYINLDSSGFEKTALGGGCFTISVRSTQNDKAIASVFDVFDGLSVIREAIGKLQEGKTTIRFSSFRGGDGGEKVGSINFAIYTDKGKEETIRRLDEVLEEIKPRLDDLKLATEGFVLYTKFFRYGETKKNSKEAEVFADAICEVTGEYPDANGSCLSDLSIFLNYGAENSFNYGMLRGSKDGGGAHQPNEHVDCDNLMNCAKSLALFLTRI